MNDAAYCDNYAGIPMLHHNLQTAGHSRRQAVDSRLQSIETAGIDQQVVRYQ